MTFSGNVDNEPKKRLVNVGDVLGFADFDF